MARKASNDHLQFAKKAKNDEFYTQLSDIYRELEHYSEHFQGKVVYCNCDDPNKSNFFRYFASNFHSLGLKKLIASCYIAPNTDLFSQKESGLGYYCEYIGDNKPINVKQLSCSGDFRSDECINLLKQADIVVTNPPFSLFREFISLLMKHNKKFLVIGNINAITYRDIFSLIQLDKVWLGVNLGRGISGFIVPDHYKLYGTETSINEEGERIVSPNNCLWLTNLTSPNRRMKLKLTKTYLGNEMHYPRYDNFDAINVSRTKDIPMDYKGTMGVPITFLHKYNPDQFEIVRFRKGDDGKDLSIKGKNPYFRILVRYRQNNSK